MAETRYPTTWWTRLDHERIRCDVCPRACALHEGQTGLCFVCMRLGPDVPVHFTAFHPDWKLRDRPPTPAVTLTRAREIARANGIRYAYTGNVHDVVGQSTYCHGCGAVLIERDWYELHARRLDARGRCAACGEPCAGIFDGVPGRWGARRLPVRLRV